MLYPFLPSTSPAFQRRTYSAVLYCASHCHEQYVFRDRISFPQLRQNFDVSFPLSISPLIDRSRLLKEAEQLKEQNLLAKYSLNLESFIGISLPHSMHCLLFFSYHASNCCGAILFKCVHERVIFLRKSLYVPVFSNPHCSHTPTNINAPCLFLVGNTSTIL